MRDEINLLTTHFQLHVFHMPSMYAVAYEIVSFFLPKVS